MKVQQTQTTVKNKTSVYPIPLDVQDFGEITNISKRHNGFKLLKYLNLGGQFNDSH